MKSNSRTDMVAVGLGLIGLVGTIFAFSFKFSYVSYGVAWSLFLPTLAALALGRRGALLAALAGLYGLYPFVLYADGLGNLVTLGITVAFLYAHGWAAEKRREGSVLRRHRMFVVQALYAAAIIPVYLVGYQMLSPGLFADSVVLGFALKEAANGLVALALADSLLNLPALRRILGLPVDSSFNSNGKAVLAVLVSGFAFIGLLGVSETYLLEGRRGILFWNRPASDILFIGWLVLSFLLIIGGKMASLLQNKLAGDICILEEKDRYKNIFENIQDIYYESELDGTTLEVSPSIERIMGVSRLDMIGRKGRFIEALKTKLLQDGFLQNEFTTMDDRNGNDRVLSVNARLVYDIEGKPKVIGIIRDVTELEASRMELVRMNQELEAHVRLRTAELEAAVKELEAFSHTVSHDLKSPVRSVDSYCQFILEDYGHVMPTDVREMLGNVRAICGDMLHFIQRLLEYAVVSKADFTAIRFSSGEVVKSVIGELMREAGRREVIVDVVSELPDLWGDPTLFRQMVANGLSNAMKFTRTCRQAVIRISCETDGEMVRFAIADNGIGFEPEKAERLFDIFHKLHMPEDYEGAGIGLATVQKCAERQGGTAWIKGFPNGGAVLYFKLYPAEEREHLNAR